MEETNIQGIGKSGEFTLGLLIDPLVAKHLCNYLCASKIHKTHAMYTHIQRNKRDICGDNIVLSNETVFSRSLQASE